MFKRVLHTKSLTLSAAYDASKTLGYTSDYGASVLPEFFKSQHIAFGASPADFMRAHCGYSSSELGENSFFRGYRGQVYHMYFQKYGVFTFLPTNGSIPKTGRQRGRCPTVSENPGPQPLPEIQSPLVCNQTPPSSTRNQPLLIGIVPG